MKPPTSMPVGELACEILEYVLHHPKAEDTLEGVVEWWLLEQRIEWTTTHVRAALAKLVAQDLMIEQRGPDGRAYFQANRRKLKQIQKLLRKPAGRTAVKRR